jgi:hypothetical protein
MADRKQKETDRKNPGQDTDSKDTSPLDYFSPARPHLLKLPSPPNIMPSAGDKVFNT